MKKKVFFLLSHLGAGGSERVFWLLSQYFDKSAFEVSLVLLDSRNCFFSTDLKDVKLIHLNTIRVSTSFLKMYKLIKEERPYAVFTTGGHITSLLSLLSVFVNIPILVGRESCSPEVLPKLGGIKEKFLDFFVPLTYKRINIAVCQSIDIKYSLSNHYKIDRNKLVVIHNPVLVNGFRAKENLTNEKKIIIVARLAIEKGIVPFLDIMAKLPSNYSLSIAGIGPLEEEIRLKIADLGLDNRVKLLGLVKNVTELITQYDMMALPSLAEGFPNVVLESLSVGVPVVAFRVSGIKELLRNDFNGYIIEPGDFEAFEKAVLKTCTKFWDATMIKDDVDKRFGVEKIVKQYEKLLLSANSLSLK